MTDTKVSWKIKNFSSLRKKSYLQSDKFSFADFNWYVTTHQIKHRSVDAVPGGIRFIGFYTDGDNEESRGYFSIYLFLDVNHVPKGKAVTIEYYLTFINHKDPDETVKKGSCASRVDVSHLACVSSHRGHASSPPTPEFKTTFPIKGGQGWGDRKAVLASKITAEDGFLKQDTLYVEAEISVKKVMWNL